jgi:hypothetical protein
LTDIANGGRAAEGSAPRLAVVLATPDRFETIRQTVSHLARQSARGEIELILVAPSVADLQCDEALLAGFARVVRVEVGTVGSIGSANAAGIRRATAPVVALAEDHAFPQPDWAAQLLAAHEGPWVAVGPSVENANPQTAVSRADLYIGYSPWLAPGTPHDDVEYLPGHNSSYKTAVLLGYGADLADMMNAETLLHWDLRRRGERLRFAPAARIVHANFSLWRSWLPAQYDYGRLFAGLRARGMSPWRRVVYVAGSPLIPLVRLMRIRRDVERAQAAGWWLDCLHALVAGLFLDALGQMVGYALGPGDAEARVSRFEYHRRRHMRADEVLELWPA